jgi:hypothetical protein
MSHIGKWIALQQWPNIQGFVCKYFFYGPFFSTEKTVTRKSYLDMLVLFLPPQLQQDSDVADILSQQDNTWFIITVGSHLSLIPHSPISGLAKVDLSGGCHGHPASHALIFISGAVWRKKFVPPLPPSSSELRDRNNYISDECWSYLT